MEKLIDFINKSPSAFHCTKNCIEMLEKSGFKRIYENEENNLIYGQKYYAVRNNSAFIAFIMGDIKDGLDLIATHNDSPCPFLKPNPIISDKMGYSFFDTEIYGGAILSSWVDRPLSLCGRLTIKTDDIFNPEEKLIDIKKPIAIIPNLAIHLNREINDGFKYTKQKEMLPIICTGKADNINDIISEYTKIDSEDILDFELFLYPTEKACILGTKDEFISSARLDNLLMTFSALKAICETNANKGIKMIYCADNEEVGSNTSQGALSDFLKNIISKISNGERIKKGFVISADAAHALHPSYSDKYDVLNSPVAGKGICLKYSSAKKYSTDAVSGGIFKSLCQKAKIKMQKFANHSDIAGGSTIGAMISADIGLPVADMGVPLIAMHSARELGAVEDIKDCQKLFNVFF